MKDFKLKTLAAVCLFTISAYGMEESPEISSKANSSYLYCVDDEDAEKEFDGAFTGDMRAQALLDFFNRVDEMIDSKKYTFKHMTDLVSALNSQASIRIAHAYENPEDENRTLEAMSLFLKVEAIEGIMNGFGEKIFP